MDFTTAVMPAAVTLGRPTLMWSVSMGGWACGVGRRVVMGRERYQSFPGLAVESGRQRRRPRAPRKRPLEAIPELSRDVDAALAVFPREVLRGHGARIVE